jgi:hypothetical protein
MFFIEMSSDNDICNFETQRRTVARVKSSRLAAHLNEPGRLNKRSSVPEDVGVFPGNFICMNLLNQTSGSPL